MRAPRLAAAACLLALGSCRALPEIPAGTCGNHVVEPGEDCDGFDRLGKSCRPPGGIGECHLDCSGLPANGQACPAGYGCDPAGVCRKPAGDFETMSTEIPGAALRLDSGDFDGDGRRDVISQGLPGFFGLTQIGIHYFDRGGAPEDSWLTSQLFGHTRSADLNGDGRSDLLLAQLAIMAMFGESNRALTPFAYPSYYVEGGSVWVTPLLDLRVDRSSSLSVLRHVDGAFQLERPASEPMQRLVPVAWLEGELDALAGEPTASHLYDDREERPCQELAIAVKGLAELSLFQLCEKVDGKLEWRAEPLVTRLAFEPPAEPTASPLFADLDGEGHDDVLIATSAGVYAAYNDGKRIEPLQPLSLFGPSDPESDEEPELFPDCPIAAGDLSADGLADLIFPGGLAVAEREDGGRIAYRGIHAALQGHWTSALVTDLNGDGKQDAIATSADNPGVEFFLGTASERLNRFMIPTVSPVRELAVGDYDGDTVLDLAYILPARDLGDDDGIAVAYGRAGGFPEPPIEIAHARAVRQLIAGTDVEVDTTQDLLVVSDLPDDSLRAGSVSTLSILVGTTDHVFFSPILLTTFAMDGVLEEASGLFTLPGRFVDRDRLDLVAVGGTDPNPADNHAEFYYTLWALPDFKSGTSLPRPIPWEFPPELEPVLIAPDGSSASLLATFVAGDLDGDDLDEIVVAAPTAGGSRCLLAWAKVREDLARLDSLATLSLEEACDPEPRLEVTDLDADGAADLALLVGRDETRAVQIFWNEGGAAFSTRSSTRLEHPAGISAFAPFAPAPDAALELAYATGRSVNLIGINPADRSFATERTLQIVPALERVTSIAAGDVNGDGVNDLAIADAGAIRILKARLAP